MCECMSVGVCMHVHLWRGKNGDNKKVRKSIKRIEKGETEGWTRDGDMEG